MRARIGALPEEPGTVNTSTGACDAREGFGTAPANDRNANGSGVFVVGELMLQGV